MGLLDGKVAIVTGGTSGIGARTAELFAAEGARVVIAGRRRARGEALVSRLGSACASFVETDVTREADVAAVIAHTVTVFGRLDCLFNNAGIPGRLTATAETDIEHHDAIMAVHVRGTLLGMKHAAPVMIAQKSGSIINTASGAGLRAGYSGHSYSAAKAALIHLTKCVSIELGENGVRVNSISPGAIATGIFGKGAGLPGDEADRTADRLRAGFATLQPIPRAGLPNDIAQAALFLASGGAEFINGHDLVVDGGAIAGQAWSKTLTLRDSMAKQAAGRPT